MPEKNSVFRPPHGDLGAVFSKSCLFTSGFASCYTGGPKWCSKTKILWHFNDLRMPSALKKNRFCTCSEVHACLSSGPHALLFIHRYNDVQRCQEWLSETCKLISCSAFHEMMFSQLVRKMQLHNCSCQLQQSFRFPEPKSTQENQICLSTPS